MQPIIIISFIFLRRFVVFLGRVFLSCSSYFFSYLIDANNRALFLAHSKGPINSKIIFVVFIDQAFLFVFS